MDKSRWPLPGSPSITCCYHCKKKEFTSTHNCHTDCEDYIRQCKENEARKAEERKQLQDQSDQRRSIYGAYNSKRRRF